MLKQAKWGKLVKPSHFFGEVALLGVWCLLALFSDGLIKPLKVIADGHGEGEQLFERLAGGLKIHRDATGGELDAGWEIGKHLVDDGGGGLDGNAGLPSCAEAVEGLSQVMAASALVGSGLAGGHLAQVSDQPVAIGEAIGADLERDARSEDLLGSAAADAKHSFDGGAVDPRLGQGNQLG